jgi:uncharacterized protein HemX
MEPDNTSYFRIHKKLLLVIVLILAAVFAGWMLGRNGESEKTAQTDQPEQSVSETDDSEGYRTVGSNRAVKALRLCLSPPMEPASIARITLLQQ